jgi:hypothetical protein
MFFENISGRFLREDYSIEYLMYAVINCRYVYAVSGLVEIIGLADQAWCILQVLQETGLELQTK